jgi:mono/diheme cytochrome c family protein
VSTRVARGIFWLLLAACVALRIPSLQQPAGADQSLYAYIGERILHGEVPFRDDWDQKPPGIHATYAVLWAIWPDERVVPAADLVVAVATALLLLALAFGATAAGEFVREGARKPYTIRGVLYSTSVKPAEIAELRRTGATANDPYPLRDADRYPSGQLQHGAKVFRVLCDVCHTMHGGNGLVHLTRTWTDDQLRLNIAKLQKTKGFMPPFAGTAEDVEALVQLVRWDRDERPASWPASTNPETLAQIARWLDEAGVK